jgi:energy-converting hydrogenase A subunit M
VNDLDDQTEQMETASPTEHVEDAAQQVTCDDLYERCQKAFKIVEAGYADILAQMQDTAFEHQLHERLELAERDKCSAAELGQANFEHLVNVRRYPRAQQVMPAFLAR